MTAIAVMNSRDNSNKQKKMTNQGNRDFFYLGQSSSLILFIACLLMLSGLTYRFSENHVAQLWEGDSFNKLHLLSDYEEGSSKDLSDGERQGGNSSSYLLSPYNEPLSL